MPLHRCIFSIKAIRFNKFYFRNFKRRLLKQFFFLEHRHLKDVFLGAPSKDRARQTDFLTYALTKLVLDALMVAFLKKRKTTLIATEKRLQVQKVSEILVSLFKCFNCYIVSLCSRFSAWSKGAFASA